VSAVARRAVGFMAFPVSGVAVQFGASMHSDSVWTAPA
jgi:hypothetical protein